MALGASFVWKNADATRDLNARLKQIVLRGIVWGGEVNPGTGLNVDVNPFVGVSFDGMTVGDPDVITLPVAANQTQYVVVRAKYNDLGSPATPTLAWQVLEESVYNSDPEKDFLIVFCKVVLGPAVSVTLADLDFTVRDEINPLGRDWYRGVVDDPSFLPPHPPIVNRIGDFYFVKSDQTFHFWDGTQWEPLNTGSYNTETTLMNRQLWRSERDRITEGTGFLGGIRPSTDGDLAARPEVSFTGAATVVDGFGLDTFAALVNGHYAEIHAQNVQLTAKPVLPGAERYDLVFLEVWRENLSAPPTPTPPENFLYERNPDGTLTYDILTASNRIETIQWTAGIAGANFNVNPIECVGHDWYVTRWRLGNIRDVDPSALHNPNGNVVVTAATNVDGVAFSPPPAGADNRAWIATSATTPADGVSWAMPLLVVKRTELEDPGSGNGIMQYRNNLRYIFHVYPECDVSSAAKTVVDTVHKQEEAPYGLVEAYDGDLPSGFLNGMDRPVGPEGTPIDNRIEIGDAVTKIRIRTLDMTFRGSKSVLAYLPEPPSTGWSRQLMYIKMNITLYPHYGGADWETLSATKWTKHFLSTKHFPYLPSAIGSLLEGQGNKRGYVTFEIVTEDLGAVDVLDDDDAMAAAAPSPVSATNWTRGDRSLTNANSYYLDGGIYSRDIDILEDDRVHPFETEWAIPVALIHRRNTTAWNPVTNPNGTGSGRPDGRTDAKKISADDLVDLRRYADCSEEELEGLLKSDIDKLMRGELRTRLANKWAGTGTGGEVAGSRILQTDYIGSGAPLFELPAPDGSKRIWSDAREFHVVARQIDLSVPSSDALYDYTPGAPGTLVIRSPANAHLIRHLPAAIIVDGNPASSDYADYISQPCWSTQSDFRQGYVTQSATRRIDTTTDFEQDIAFGATYEPAFTVTAIDAIGHATEMTCNTITSTTGLATLSWWVHYDRDISFFPNHGLAEIPDTVHQVIKGPNSGSPKLSNVGCIYAVVRVPVVANTATITLADVQAATSVPGTVTKLIGFDRTELRLDPEPDTANSFALAVMTLAQDQISLAWNAPPVYNGEVDVIVFFETDLVDSWVEVGRGGKSVRAYYQWHEHDRPTAPTTVNYAFSLGSDIWEPVEIEDSAPNYTATVFPMIWWKNNPGDPWTYQPTGAGVYAGQPYSNLVTIYDMNTAGVGPIVRIYVPKHVAPAAATLSDEFQISYTYTPYQGLSSDGGSVAVPATAVPKLQKLLHGTVQASSDYYITQSGACSLFGGVDSWSGIPARIEGLPHATSQTPFWLYNATALVSPQEATGKQQLNPLRANKKSLAAAAILRLPFPGNPNMQNPVPANYHSNTQDFDIDPGREGASAGFRAYAPTYMLEPAVTFSFSAQLSQFVNGITPLAVRGEPRAQSNTQMLFGSSFTPDSDLDPTLYKQKSGSDYGVWEIPASSECGYDAVVPTKEYDLVTGVAVQVGHWSTGDTTYGSGQQYGGVLIGMSRLATSMTTPGVANPLQLPYRQINPIGSTQDDYQYTAIRTFSDETVFLMYYPGMVQQYHQWLYRGGFPIVRAVVNAGAGVPRVLRSATVYVDTDRDSYHIETFPTKTLFTDLITIPMGSASTRTTKGRVREIASAAINLKGREIAYPDSWTGSTETALEAAIVPSVLYFNNYGRGVYLGNKEKRFNMPVFVPGSGDSLDSVCGELYVTPDTTTQPPEQFPYFPTETPFVNSNRAWFPLDHGGPIAYSFYGLIVNPTRTSDATGRAVISLSGGPLLGLYPDGSEEPDVTDGTAIDAFWPSKRPLLKHR